LPRLFELVYGLGVALLAAREAKTKSPSNESWKDKWEHGYVGCKLRRWSVSFKTTLTIAKGKELADRFIGGVPSAQDIKATMFGWKKAHWKRDGLKLKSCKEVCDHFKSNWMSFGDEE
jgi:hypothetical protein